MIPLAKVQKAFDDLIQADGVDCSFVLRDTTAFTIRGMARFQAENSLTDGLQQDKRKLSVMETRWRAAAPLGRNPEKGDQVTIHGHRYAVEEADPALMQNTILGWRIKLKG